MFKVGFEKIALNLPDQALVEANAPMETAVPGTSLRDEAETGQPKKKNTRTHNVINEDRVYNKKLRVKSETARYGRRNHVS